MPTKLQLLGLDREVLDRVADLGALTEAEDVNLELLDGAVRQHLQPLVDLGREDIDGGVARRTHEDLALWLSLELGH